MRTTYDVEFEVEGPMAMFARPDTGSTPISYPVPTWSACKAMFESVARGVFHGPSEPGGTAQPAAFFCPTQVEIWRPIRFESYTTNYRGPLRKANQMTATKNTSYQLRATVLVDVCYRIRGTCKRVPGAPDSGGNAPHALQEMFTRRLSRKQSKYAPSLGWKEFLPSYFGPTRHDADHGGETRRLQADLQLELPSLLLTCWDSPTRGRYEPIFAGLQVRNGILNFPEYRHDAGRFSFAQASNAD